MSWTKLHTDPWLYGAIRKLPPEMRAVWPDLQAQADKSIIRGIICAAPGVGYSMDQLVKMWNTPLQVLTSALNFFKTKRISDDPKDPNYKKFWIKIQDDGTICLNEWLRFQDEYQRLKAYRTRAQKDDTQNDAEEGTINDTEKSTTNDTEKGHSENAPQIQIQIQNADTELREEDSGEATPPQPADKTDPRYKSFIKIFDTRFKETRSGKPIYGKKDFAQMKTLLEKDKELTDERFKKAILNCDKDAFFSNNFNLAFICSRFNDIENFKTKEEIKRDKEHADAEAHRKRMDELHARTSGVSQ